MDEEAGNLEDAMDQVEDAYDTPVEGAALARNGPDTTARSENNEDSEENSDTHLEEKSERFGAGKGFASRL
jgi:hypothetical protein